MVEGHEEPISRLLGPIRAFDSYRLQLSIDRNRFDGHSLCGCVCGTAGTHRSIESNSGGLWQRLTGIEPGLGKTVRSGCQDHDPADDGAGGIAIAEAGGREGDTVSPASAAPPSSTLAGSPLVAAHGGGGVGGPAWDKKCPLLSVASILPRNTRSEELSATRRYYAVPI